VSQRLGDLRALGLALRVRVARLLGADLGGRDGLARLAQPALELGLLAGAGAELVGGGPAALLVGLALARRGVPPQGGGGGGLGGGRGLAVALRPRCQRVDPGAALNPRALGLLREAALRAQLGHELGPADRGGPVAGRLAAAVDQPRGAAGGLGGLVALARCGAQLALGGVARGPRLADRGLRRVGRALGLGLVARGLLGGGHEPVAAVALLEDPLLAPSRGLPHLPGRSEVGATLARGGDAGELRGHAREVLDEPCVREQAAHHGRVLRSGINGIDKGGGPGAGGSRPGLSTHLVLNPGR
jgi:hypothetical protein